MKTVDLGEDPTEESRESDDPVGLKVLLVNLSNIHVIDDVQNLGATCYANASLQVRLIINLN